MNTAGVGQAFAGIMLACMVREESPGSIGQGCWLTASGGDSKESATENRPPAFCALEPIGARGTPHRGLPSHPVSFSIRGGKGETVR